jgi:hypothetical protein
MQRRRMEGEEQELVEVRAVRKAHTEQPGSLLSQDLRGARQGERGWEEQRRRRRQGGANKGSSTIKADGGVAAPVSVFISGTSPNCNEDGVKEKLLQCAAAVPVEQGLEGGVKLVILKVEHIPIKIPYGEERRSRCWKVTLAPEFAGHMAKGEAYPAAWGWRKWRMGPQVSQAIWGGETVDVGA